MARASMSSMAMFPPTPTGTFYSGIRPNYGHPPSVSHISHDMSVCVKMLVARLTLHM